MSVTISRVIPVNRGSLFARVIFSDRSTAEIRRSPKGTRYVSVGDKITNIAEDKLALIDAKFPFYL